MEGIKTRTRTGNGKETRKNARQHVDQSFFIKTVSRLPGEVGLGRTSRDLPGETDLGTDVHVASESQTKTRVYTWRSHLLDFKFGVVDVERRCMVYHPGINNNRQVLFFGGGDCELHYSCWFLFF